LRLLKCQVHRLFEPWSLADILLFYGFVCCDESVILIHHAAVNYL
jgi:hypothetical protein